MSAKLSPTVRRDYLAARREQLFRVWSAVLTVLDYVQEERMINKVDTENSVGKSQRARQVQALLTSIVIVEKQTLDLVNSVVAELLDVNAGVSGSGPAGAATNVLQEVKQVKERLLAALEAEPMRVRLLMSRLQDCMRLSTASTSPELDVPLHAIDVRGNACRR